MNPTHPLVGVLQTPDPPVELAALLVAQDAHPTLDVEACLARLDAMAAPLRARVAGVSSPWAQAEALAELFGDTLGFAGNDADYYDPRNSYLHEVLARRTGIPITLAVVLVALGRRAGLRVEGVGFPGHFLVRVGGVGGVLADPFGGGRPLEEDALAQLVLRFVGDPRHLTDAHFATVDTRAVVVRMLHNLVHAHARRGGPARAMVACDRLVDLTGAPEARRDRGLFALALGASAAATGDLEAYLAARPAARDVNDVRAALERARRGAGPMQ